MFKNELLLSLASKPQQSQPKQDEYSNGLNNVRSVERLKSIEEEIEKDYSKYVNEYGLTKTAFAKAVNSLREKQQINFQQNLLIQQQQQQQIMSQPTTTRKVRMTQNSNEKKRTGSTNVRSGSASQTRKTSNSRQQNYKQGQVQESVNDLYMNTQRHDQQQKQIRSVRAKTHLSSQNSSSCFQRSQKLSPDKCHPLLSGTSSNLLGITMTSQQNQQPAYITLKAQPSKDAKGIKIKLPLNSQRGSSGTKQQPNNISSNQTPKRIKLQKTKSSSNIPICFSQRGQPTPSILLSSRGRTNVGQDMVIMDELSQQMNATNPTLQYIPLKNIRASQNFQDLHTPLDQNLISQNFFPQQTFTSASHAGTYATTSILNSPQQFKSQVGLFGQQILSQQPQQPTRNNSKGKQQQLSSRNGTSSVHQSQKSIGGNSQHQRASSSMGLNGSNTKSKQSLGGASDTKRLSSGSNVSKRQSQGSHHQAQSSNVQQQILQLLMSYQSQHDPELTGISSQNQTQGLKILKSNNTQSMKDLKSLKQQPTSSILKDLQIIKAPKHGFGQPSSIVLQQTQGLNTQRQGGQTSILMVNNQRKSSKTGKMTSRGEGSKKRVIQQQNIVIPYQSANDFTASTNQYSHMQGSLTSNDLSSRIHNVLGMTDQTASQLETKRLLSQSKSQENLDLIKLAAQRAALEQQMNSQSLVGKSDAMTQAANKFLQNLKHQENQVPISKLKMMPSSAAFQQSSIQTARNVQFDQSNYRSNGKNESEQNNIYSSKGPTNIIIGNNFDKQSQSRRTSGKFNPSSTRSQHQQQ